MESSESSQATVRREERTHESRLTQLSQTLRHEHERESERERGEATLDSLSRSERAETTRHGGRTKRRRRKEGTAEHDEHRMDWRFGVQWEREEGL